MTLSIDEKWTRIALAVCLLGVLVGACLMNQGCIAEGHRRVSIEFFGQSIVVEDEAYPDTNGEAKFKAGFDPESSLVNAFIGWMFSAPTDETAKAEEPTTVEPG